jgi:hypothetical protein
MKTRNLLAALLLAATALAAAPASAQNLLVNGDFETGDFSGWTLSPGTFSMVGNDPLFAQSGNHNAFLEATGFIVKQSAPHPAGCILSRSGSGMTRASRQTPLAPSGVEIS